MSSDEKVPRNERIDPDKILGCPNRAPYVLRWLWARGHMALLCGRCSEGTRQLRDITDEGRCWWWHNWERGNYDIPFWMGNDEKERLGEVRRRHLDAGRDFPHISSLDSALKCTYLPALRRLLTRRK